MMMLFYFGFFLLLLLVKDFFFVSSFLMLDSGLSLMFSIFPLVFFMIYLSSFNFSFFFESLVFNFVFFFIFFFLFFCFNSTSSINFLIFLEICVVFLIFMIFFFSKDDDKVSSTFFMFFINIFPSIFFMVFCMSLGDCSYSFYFNLFEFDSFFFFLCFTLLLVSKLPLFFFHFWLMKAHVSASGCGSMILASLMLKVGTIGLYKFYGFFLNLFKNSSSFLMSVSVLGLIFISLLMTRFFDFKYMVACSSVVHMSPIFPFCLWGDPSGIFGSILMMVGHGLVSYLIFFLVSLIYENSHNRSLDFNKSLMSFSGSFNFFFFVFILMNLGFPPFLGFLSEIFFIRSFFVYSILIYLVFFFSLLLTGFIFFFFISKIFFGKKHTFLIFDYNSFLYLVSGFYLYFYVLLPFFFF